MSVWEVVDVRWFFLSVFSLLFPVLCRSQVVLNEVYYDHVGTDEGYEFIELVNPAGVSIALEGYAIEFHDGASAGWVTIWRANLADTIAAAGLFVVGGERVVPPADARAELGLQNGPDAVRLVAAGHTLDLLGYGLLSDAQYFEAAPAPDVESGMSLARLPDGADSDNNANDFAAAAPSPGRFNIARHDVALRLAGGTPSRDARSDAGVEVFSFDVLNLGIEPVNAGAVTVEVADSNDLGVMPTIVAPASVAIPSGDSARVDIAVDLSIGYHRLRAAAVCAADERPENDTVLILRRVGLSPLVVSEVMSDPCEGCPEYVELFNSGAVPYDLAGHWMHDAAHAPELIVSTTRIIPPGGFLALTGDSDRPSRVVSRTSRRRRLWKSKGDGRRSIKPAQAEGRIRSLFSMPRFSRSNASRIRLSRRTLAGEVSSASICIPGRARTPGSSRPPRAAAHPGNDRRTPASRLPRAAASPSFRTRSTRTGRSTSS